MSQWRKVCLCKVPLNPHEFFVNCDKCHQWFHPNCIGIREEDVSKIKECYCLSCKQTLNNALN